MNIVKDLDLEGTSLSATQKLLKLGIVKPH